VFAFLRLKGIFVEQLLGSKNKMAAPVGKPVVRIFQSDQAVAENLCSYVTNIANESIKQHGKFTIALSGGSLAKYLNNGLPKANTDWSKWRIYFCDERHVPFNDPECTYSIYKRGLFSAVNIPEENIFPDNPNVSVEDAAKEYEAKLRAEFPGQAFPRFDLLLLGMGPDGHTCSLFPGHPLLKEDKLWIAPISDSPKPPPQRITMTFPVLNNATNAIFVSCGGSKAEMVQRVLEGSEQPPLPAAQVLPHSGCVYWFLDNGASQLLAQRS